MSVRVAAECDCCGKSTPLAAKSIKGGVKEVSKTWISATVEFNNSTQQLLFCDRCAVGLGLLMPCPGEAHEVIRNGGDQDHCLVCAPRWNAVQAHPVPEIKWDDIVALYKKLNTPAEWVVVETPEDADPGDDGVGNIYLLEENYLTTTQLT